MARLRVSLTGLIITLLCASAMDPFAAFALKDHTRDGWMVGFSLGGGPGKLEDAQTDTELFSETGGVFGLRVGRKIHPSIVLGAEIHGWNRTEKAIGLGETIESDFTFANFALTGTYYPTDPTTPLGGLYLRGGIAASTVENEVTTGGISLSIGGDLFDSARYMGYGLDFNWYL